MLSLYPLDVLDEIWDLIESVSKGCLVYSPKQHFYEVTMKLANGFWKSWPLKIFSFLAWAWLAKAKGHSCHTKKSTLAKVFTEKKTSKSAKFHRPLRYEKMTG